MATRREPGGGSNDSLLPMLAGLALLAVATPLVFRAAQTWLVPHVRTSSRAAADWLSRWLLTNWWLVAFWTVGLTSAWVYRRRLRRRPGRRRDGTVASPSVE